MQFKSFGSAIGLSLLIAASAQAGWGSSGYYGYGSSGGYRASYYGSSGGYGYGSSGGSYGYGSSGYSSYYASSGGSSGYHVGPIRRLAGAIHSHMAAKHARWQARRSYYGSSGYSSYGSSGGYSVYRASYGSSGYSSSYGSSGGYSASYGSSGGYSASYGSSGGYTSSYSGGSSGGSVSYGSTGGVYYGASTTSVAASSMLASSTTVNDSVNLTVSVPTAAKIYVNGNPTTSTGAVRQFVSHGLQSGKEYRFKLRAELETASGDTLTEEKDVVVGAGAFEHIAFAFDNAADAAIETAVTLNVPEGATVRLAGSDTAVTGSQRTYRTQRMKLGEVWDDYQIEVTHEGHTKRQSIRLIAGDQLEMTFNFGEDRSRIAMVD